MKKVISTEGAYIILDKKNDRVIKIIKPYWMKKCPWIIKNEVRAIERLSHSKHFNHFPKLFDYDENSITTDYTGDSVLPVNISNIPLDVREFSPLPEDYEEQMNEILDALEESKLRHSDINHGHLLVKNGVLKLVDFELCLEFNEPEPINYMKTMGVEAMTRDINEPIDDRLMAHRTLQKIKGGIQKIYDLIKELPSARLYHELPFFNLLQKPDRKFLKERIELLKSAYDFKNKKGLDLGANVGGVTFSLALEGAKMTGVDIDSKLINIANACEDYYKLGCIFIEDNIKDYVNNLKEHYDFCTLLAVWHWLVKYLGIEIAKDILNKISKKCNVMFIEVNFGPEQGLVGSEETMINAGLTNERKFIDFIIKNTEYNKIKNIGKCIGWANRPTFFCTK